MAPKASVVASSPQMLRRPYSPAGSTSPAGNTSPPSSPAGNTSPPSRQMPISSPAGSSTSQKSSAKKRTATSPAGAVTGPKQVKDSACIGMLINARTRMVALGQARLIVALKERLDSDSECAGMCNTLMERIDRSKVARVALHRNDRYLSDIKIWLMTMIFDRSLNCEGIDCGWT